MFYLLIFPIIYSSTLDGPRFLSDPEDPGADVGDSVMLSCATDGNPQPAIVWRRRGATRILSSQGSLRISSVTDDHFAPSTVFVCTATAQGYDEIQREVLILKKGKVLYCGFFQLVWCSFEIFHIL